MPNAQTQDGWGSIIDVTTGVERDAVADLTKEIIGIATDFPAALLVRVDAIHHNEGDMIWQTVMRLRRKAEVQETRVFMAKRRLDPSEMFGAIVDRL